MIGPWSYAVLEQQSVHLTVLDAAGVGIYANRPGGPVPVGAHYDSLATGEPRLHQALQGTYRDWKPVEVEVLMPSGRVHHYSLAPLRGADGTPAVLVKYRDVTEERRTEHLLRESEENWRSLVEQAPDLIVIADAEGRIEFINRGVGGYTVEQVRGVPIFAFSPSTPVEEQQARLARVAASGLSESYELTVPHPDGQDRIWWSRIGVIRRPNAPHRFMVLSRDVSAERALQKRLELNDRLTSLGTLAAGMAHEINNPLTYVLANLEYAVKRLAQPVIADRERLASVLADALEGAERTAQIVADLRAFAHGEAGMATGAVDLRQVIESSVRMVAREVSARARLVVEVGDVPAVSGTPSRLAQVFVNLLLNAAQSIAEGAPEANQVSLRVVSVTDARVTVQVADTGCGIPAALRDRLFDPFFTTKEVGKGTGLGLAICHGIVTAVGGTLEPLSTPGPGATFQVSLPVAPGAAAEASPIPVGDADRPQRILVIDDDPPVLRSLALCLEEHEVSTASSGAEALALLATDQGFDLILCDVMMPEMSGVELYRRIAALPGGLVDRVVFTTGGVFNPEVQEFLRSVPNRCLTKPISPRDLAEAIAARSW